MGSYRVCCCFTRRFKVTEADPPLDVKTAFNDYTDGAIHMTADQLLKFIHENQNGNVSVNGNGVAVTKTDAERIVEQVLHKRHPITSLINRKTFTLEDFHHYLFSFEFNPPIGSQKS
ncbi:putative phosphoinositide phospholipase C [Helianthus anomalus]